VATIKRVTAVVVFVLSSAVCNLLAQNCRAQVQTVPGDILFSPQQEEYLGDLVSRAHATTAKVLDDEKLSAPLRRIGKRLGAFAPEGAPEFQFSLIDLPHPNAYVIPGAHVFVSRKLVLMAKSEDELAGVMAHEMGHEVTRQIARDYSDMWRAVLRINSVGDRADVEQKFDDFYDTLASSHGVSRSVFKKMNKEQIEADSAGLLMMSRAGYDSKAYFDFFDRLAETKGKTGNWFTDLFGATSPDSRRLREIQKNLVPTPVGCSSAERRLTPSEFAEWQKTLMKYSGPADKDSIAPGILKHTLQDPLRPEISQLRFSPDGRYILAQDNASIYVLSRDPFKFLFRIDADEVQQAQFTADSNSVLLMTDQLRVEKWSIDQEQQTDVYEPTVVRSCHQAVLSPTGNYLACLQLGEDGRYPLQLSILNARTGDTIWTKPGAWSSRFLVINGHYAWIDMPASISLEFSPDGRYLLGYGDSGPIAYDLKTNKTVDLTWKFIDHLKQDFVFLSNDTILGLAGKHGEHSAIMKFPSGENLSELVTGDASLERAGKGDYVVLRPVAHYRAGVMDLKTKKVFIGTKNRAIDIYDGVFVNERKNGELGLYRDPGQPPIAIVNLPVGPVRSFRAAAVSPDLRYIAYSDATRGAIWDQSTGARLQYLRGFGGAFFDGNQSLLLTFPPQDSYWGPGGTTKEEARQIRTKEWNQEELKKNGAQTVRVSLANNQFTELFTATARFSTWQVGRYLLASAAVDENAKPLKERQLEVRDAATGKVLWSRNFHGMPKWHVQATTNSAEFIWEIDEEDAKEILKSESDLRAKVEALKNKASAKLVEVVDLDSGKRRFAFPLDTGEGSYRVDKVSAAGKTVLLIDSNNRLFLLDENGKRKGRIFAQTGTLDASGRYLAAEIAPERLAIFDTTSMASVREIKLTSRPALITFPEGSKKLIVVTVDQSIYEVRLAS